MKQELFNQMSEDQLFEAHCDKSHELASLTRCYFDIKRDMAKLAKELEAIDLAMESIEASKLKAKNKLI